MANVDRYIQKKKRSHEEGNRPDFERKILREGANKFRIVGDIVFVFEHWFKSADGVSVHSVSSKRYDDKGEITGGSMLDGVVLDAQKLLNDEEGLAEGKYEAEEIERAEIIVGDRKHVTDKYPSSWKGREFAYMNIVDRDDNWCKENKKTKILCKSKSQGGVSSGKGGIFDEVVEMFEEYGDYEKYDIKMKKSGKGMATKYTCFKDGEDELSKEEKGYELWDLNEVTVATPENTVKKWLENGIKSKSNGEDKADKPRTKSVFAKGVGVKKKKEEPETEPEQEEAQEEVQETKAKEKPSNGAGKKKLTVKKAAPKPEPKSEPAKEEEEELAECPECEAMISITSEKCPECGVVFEGIDDDESDV